MTEDEIKEIGKISVEIELAVLAYLQRREGFRRWWESLTTKVRVSTEINIAERIFDAVVPHIRRKE